MSSAASGSIKSPYELLGMETALLIGTATARNIDVTVWFNEKANDGKIPLREFDSKIISLASTMGIGQDAETKQELELAVSPLSLTVIHKLCNAGDDEHGQQLIDVTYFFKISQQKIDKYLAEVGGEEEEDDDDEEEDEGPAKQSVTEKSNKMQGQENYREWKEGSYDVFGNLIQETTATTSQKPGKPSFASASVTTTTTMSYSQRNHRAEEEEDSDFVRISAEDYIKEIQAVNEHSRPGSAPAGLYGGNIRENLSSRGASRTPESSRKSATPSPSQKNPTSHSHGLKIDIKMPTNTTEGSEEILSSPPTKGSSSVNTPLNFLGSPYDEVVEIEEHDSEEEDIIVDEHKVYHKESKKTTKATKDSNNNNNNNSHRRGNNARYAQEGDEEDLVRLQSSSSPDAVRGQKQPQQPQQPQQQVSPSKRASPPQKASDRVRDWNAENREFLMVSNHIQQLHHKQQQSSHQQQQQKTASQTTTTAITTAAGTHTRLRSNSVGQVRNTLPGTNTSTNNTRPKSAERIRPNSVSGNRREREKPLPSYAQGTASSAGQAAIHVTTATLPHQRSATPTNARSSTLSNVQGRSSTPTEMKQRRNSFNGFIATAAARLSSSSAAQHAHDHEHDQQDQERLNESFGTAGTGSSPNGGAHLFTRRSIVTTATGASITAWQHQVAGQEYDMSYQKDIVEDLIREVVKKTDRYHLIQVYCGFLENYTFHPPRGPVIVSTPREYITYREIHTTFLAARLFLNDIQLKALGMLVVEFAKLYRTVYVERLKQMITLPEGAEEVVLVDESQLPDDVKELKRECKLLPKKVKGRGGQCISSIWLEKYLLHLRLSKRSASRTDGTTAVTISSEMRRSRSGSATRASKTSLPDSNNNNTVLPATEGEAEEKKVSSSQQQHPQHPTPWKEWLTKKFQEEIVTGSKSKPKELQRALTGQPHNLTKEDLEYLLKQYPILTNDALTQEIEYRLESWIYDFDGRRDFQHQLNMRIQTWIWEEQILTKKVKGVPKTKSGYQKIWERLPKEEQVKTKSDLIAMLVAEKREELKSSERTKQDISKHLFTSYEELKKSRAGTSGANMTWKDWLIAHFTKSEQTIMKMKQQEEERHLVATRQKKRKNSLASLLAIENHVKNLLTTLDTYHQIQLQKGIVALRRAARERGIEAGTVVSKEDFDVIFKPILTPYINFNETFLDIRETVYHNAPAGGQPEDGLQAASSLSQMQFDEWKKKLLSYFHQDVSHIAKQVLEDYDQLQSKNKKSFDDWLAEKKNREEHDRRAKADEEERKKQEAEMKVKQSQKAFKKWLRLRKQARYKSHVDKKYHDVPANRRVDHASRWWVNNTAKGEEEDDEEDL